LVTFFFFFFSPAYCLFFCYRVVVLQPLPFFLFFFFFLGLFQPFPGHFFSGSFNMPFLCPFVLFRRMLHVLFPSFAVPPIFVSFPPFPSYFTSELFFFCPTSDLLPPSSDPALGLLRFLFFPLPCFGLSPSPSP